MGCYAYTCALSELPIEEGDPVLLAPLAPSAQGSHAASVSRFELAFPPLPALYNHYGFVEDIAPTPFHDAFARAMGFTDTAAFAFALQSRSAEIEGRSGASPVGFCMVRRDAWDAMLALPRVWRGAAAGSLDVAAAGAAQGALLFEKVPSILARMDPADLSKLEESIKTGSYSKKRMALMILNGDLLDGVDPWSPFQSMFSGALLGHSELFVGASSLQVLALDMAARGASRSDVEQGLLLFAHALVCSSNMSSVRKVWLDRASEGPQGGESALHWLWARELGRLSEAAIDWSEDEGYLEGFAEARAQRERDALGAASGAPARAAQGLARKGL